MKKKRHIILSMVLCLLLVATSLVNAYALNDITVYAKNVNVTAGQTVKIPIYIKNNLGIAGVKLKFYYDKTKITPTNIESGNVFTNGLQDNIDGDAQPGSFNVYWASPTGDNNSTNGILFYINFKSDAYAYGESKLRITYDQADTFDENFKDVSLVCENSDIVIENNEFANMPKITVKADIKNKTVDLKLHGVNIGDIGKLNIDIAYDENAFIYKSISGNANLISNNSSVIKINSYLDSKYENDDFAVLRFDIKDGIKSGNYKFKLSSDNIDVLIDNCEVTINSAGEISITNVYIPTGMVVEKGKQIVVPVMINNNQGIMGYRLSFKYNPNELRIDSIANSNDFEGNISDSIGNTQGVFDVVWNSTENKMTNGTLVYLNFTSIAASTVKVESQIEINYSQGDTFNEKYEDVKLNCINGKVMICPGHNYKKIIINPTCVKKGYTEFECQYCQVKYYDDYIEPVGHYYIYQGNENISNVTYNMPYKCKDCNKALNSNGDELLTVWKNDLNKYCNSKPSRSDTNSQLLDTNNDDIINAKDYALFYHAHKAK